MADSVDDLFLWGDNFEEILGILKGNEALKEQFTVQVTDVSITAGTNCTNYAQTLKGLEEVESLCKPKMQARIHISFFWAEF